MLARFLAAAAACIIFTIFGAAQTKLLRFPDIHGDRVVFTFGGDLWTASVTGGNAVRLTAHAGVETYAKFSPDGKWIAFTGQYDGDEQVYVMPSGGGEPKQLTFYPSRGPLAPRWGHDNQVGGWTKDGRIYFRSQRDSWSLPIAKLYTVSPSGGPAEPLPMPEAGSGSFSPDGTKMAYSPRFRDFALKSDTAADRQISCIFMISAQMMPSLFRTARLRTVMSSGSAILSTTIPTVMENSTYMHMILQTERQPR